MEKLSPQEEELMQVIWQTGEGSVKTFLQEMPEPKAPYTTLASTVKNLEKKGFVSSRLLGNTYIYAAAVTEEAYKQTFMSGFIENYFNNSYKEMVNFFVQQKKLKSKDLQDIIEMIENQNKKK
ncbi:BlaI/MecI/CopY family transcriptional regulator [Panacibacter sp. DH6]|uniref:BlaI/MecI/CopY family transcriptional regulator n=1 Tax=Panacibacter microcysteis TaxID=2793269 RepID=A0A931GYU3_9BACT|nr:BlaI/MecI/CopY family transcriptional regulator [Panacibacter microcysteis]MBG9377802.1 BlaI/MecI/CopY family transcriptional regulator [Panacibacter microcysteis]